MLAFAQPPFQVRHALASEASLIADLRMASLLSLEMPDHSLVAANAVMTRLPDLDRELFDAGGYFVADHRGDLLGGAGWSVLPLGYRAERLLDESGHPASFTLQEGSVLLRGFFLDPDLGRQGAGARLLARVEEEAGDAGYSAAELVVPAAAQAFYGTLGFRPVRKLGLQVGWEQVLPLLQMRRCFRVQLARAA